MSFKRDSDNKAFHEAIRKRRVNELLCEDIPEDEASLLKNGRFACLVCSHRPIFDTLDMLSLHRSSKKHKYHLDIFTAKKQELEDLKRRRYAEDLVKTGQVPVESSSQHKLLHQPVYNPCHKRPKLKPHQRKSRLDLGTKDIDIDDRSSLQPHTSKPKHKKQKVEFTQTTDVESLKEKLFHKTAQNNSEDAKETKQFVNEKMNRLMKKEDKKSTILIGPQAMPPPAQEKLDYVKQYLNAVGSGWKKDRSGQWVKDEDAEFDSDDEAPEFPLPIKQST